MILEVALIALALGAAGLIKGLTGLGLPLIAIPVMAIFMDLEQAILVMALPSTVVNGWQAIQLRPYRATTAGVSTFVVGCVAGVVLGVSLFSTLPSRALAIAMAVWILAFLTVRIFRPELRLTDVSAGKIAPWAGLGSGIAQATTGIPGPIVATYFQALGQNSRQFAFCVSTAFALLGALQLVSVNWLGLYQWHHLVSGMVACIPAILVMHWTNRFAHRVSESTINRLVHGVLLVLAARLLFF